MPLTGKEMVKLLVRHGWTISRIRGSHHTMVRDGFAGHLTVPVHGNKPLGKGLEHDILKKAGLR
ncbi:addiction module toxin, HicA family [bacterium]|nr:addiction module toxin, HicA family [bacterium]